MLAKLTDKCILAITKTTKVLSAKLPSVTDGLTSDDFPFGIPHYFIY